MKTRRHVVTLAMLAAGTTALAGWTGPAAAADKGAK